MTTDFIKALESLTPDTITAYDAMYQALVPAIDRLNDADLETLAREALTSRQVDKFVRAALVAEAAYRGIKLD